MNFRIKNNILNLVIIYSILAFPQEINNWQQLNSPTSQILTEVYFIDNNNGWVGGEGGVIIGTNDGGKNWYNLYNAVDTYILDIFFLNINLGWVLFWDSYPPYAIKMLKTSNGGTDWVSEVCPGESSFYRSIYFIDSLNGFLAGPPFLKTTDLGAQWFEVNVFDVDTLPPDISGLPTKKIEFYNKDIGYACGGYLDFAGVMWWTSDGGENWAAKGLGPDPINDFYIFDSLSVLGMAGDPEGFFGIGHIKTSDGGMNWIYNELNLAGVVKALSFRTPAEGWAVVENKFIISMDSGTVWEQYSTPGNVILNDLIFTDSLTGFAVGNNGSLFKYIPSITLVDQPLIEYSPNVHSLWQNFPNPFNPSTKIKYSIPQSSIVVIKVFDVLGNEIETLVNEEKPVGTYEISWYADQLSSGVYLYRLQAGDFIQTKKMILLK